MRREPDFNNLMSVIECGVPSRPTLFEFFFNNKLASLAAPGHYDLSDNSAKTILMIKSFEYFGYDYAMVNASNFRFPTGEVHLNHTRSLNEGALIFDRKSFDSCEISSPNDYSTDALDEGAQYMSPRMKLIVRGPGGVLENVIALTGYENLCAMLYEDPELVSDIFDAVGSRMLQYYTSAVCYDSVGAIMSNDDWGFNSQTLMSPSDLRKYVFPWHKRIVEVAHSRGKPALLHSCGNYREIIDDIIYDMKYDGRHSYEDNIICVEDAYEQLCGKIAVLGGLDVNFMATKTPEEIKARSLSMLERCAKKGGYALGTGNSVPEYIPDENYFAMLSAVTNI